MSLLHRIERRLEPFAIRNLTLYLVAGQAFMLLAIQFFGVIDFENVLLFPTLVLQGEWWRLFSFIFIPASFSWLWAAFVLYFFYLCGTALESYWGAWRYNLFLLCGYVLTVGIAFITPDYPASNLFIGSAVFLAFAYLYPDFVLYIFFILPVKIKWLALFTWLLYTYIFFTGGLSAKLGIVAAVANFFIFFARDLILSARYGHRRMKAQAASAGQRLDDAQPRHRCHTCGKTDLTHPQEDFRYCSKCAGDFCYCSEHIKNHEHVTTEQTTRP